MFDPIIIIPISILFFIIIIPNTVSRIIKFRRKKKEIIVKGVIETSKSTISLSSSFDIIILDFGIKIPRLVRDKISETVKVEVNVTLKQK